MIAKRTHRCIITRAVLDRLIESGEQPALVDFMCCDPAFTVKVERMTEIITLPGGHIYAEFLVTTREDLIPT